MGTISVSNLGKAYKQYPTRWSRLLEWITPGHKPRHALKWVMQDVSFTVNPGEAVGIIGINGAGKSTLLKMITGTVQPTCGTISVTGRVAALLELGMGFHPDFTGRQNVLLASQLLGLSSNEISELIPKVEAFADIGDYIDQPVRVYSSGMQVRLAFAVATAQRPDILIIDEAMAVGDAAFQRKCFQRIEGFRSAGTTLLFVSHDIESVKKICSRAFFINAGRLEKTGLAKYVCDEYEKYLFSKNTSIPDTNKAATKELASSHSKYDPSITLSCELIYGGEKAAILECWLEDENGVRLNVVESGTPFLWCYRAQFNENIDKPIYAMMIKTKEGVAIYGVDSKALGIVTPPTKRGDIKALKFYLANNLAAGIYYFNCGVLTNSNGDVDFLARRVDSAILKVVSAPDSSAVVGVVDLHAELSF